MVFVVATVQDAIYLVMCRVGAGHLSVDGVHIHDRPSNLWRVRTHVRAYARSLLVVTEVVVWLVVLRLRVVFGQVMVEVVFLVDIVVCVFRSRVILHLG